MISLIFFSYGCSEKKDFPNNKKLSGFDTDYDLPSSYTTLRQEEKRKSKIKLIVYEFRGDKCDEFRELKVFTKKPKFCIFSTEKDLSELDSYIFGGFSEEEVPFHISMHEVRNKAYHILIKQENEKLKYVILYGLKDAKGKQFAFLRRLVSDHNSDSRYPALNLFNYLEKKGKEWGQ